MNVFPQGMENGGTVMQRIHSLTDVWEFVRMLVPIFRAVVLFQRRFMGHLDIKLANMVLANSGSFKLIDMADMVFIPTIEIDGRFTASYLYQYWPPIMWYSVFLATNEEWIHQRSLSDILTTLYNIKGKFNYTNYRNSLDAISNAMQIQYSDPSIQHHLHPIKNRLIQQLHDFFPQYANEENLNWWLNALIVPGNPQQSRINLFMRVDVYSLGIIMLYALSQYHSHSNHHEIPLQPHEMQFLDRLYINIGICCKLEYQFPNAAFILGEIEDILHKFSLHFPPPPPPLPPKNKPVHFLYPIDTRASKRRRITGGRRRERRSRRQRK